MAAVVGAAAPSGCKVRAEPIRPTPWLLAEPYRIQSRGYETRYGDPYGAFRIPYPSTGVTLLALAADSLIGQAEHGDTHAWDHVSVSVKNRCPNWLEMAFIKRIFWGEHETVMQLHVPEADHINCHPFVLHLWKPLLTPIPRPPAAMVGPVT